MAVLIASDLAKDIAGTPLLRGVSFKLERRDRLTIAGRNGAGKTTLLRMLSGEASVDGGELVFAKNTRVALHDQRPPRERDVTLRDYVLSGRREPLELEAELRRLEEAMGAGEQVMDRYAEVTARYESVGGYTWRERATSFVHGLGFVDADFDRQLSTFSGGQLTRASLARALAAEADLLLLDEPTNHLDIESLEWLEQTLLGLDTAIVMVAHDRWFLESVGTAVLELEAGRSRFFPGTWTQWRKEQAAREMRWARRSRSSRPRSSASRSSSSASAPRRPRRARPSRASRSSTRSRRSRAIRATSGRWASSSRSPSAPGA